MERHSATRGAPYHAAVSGAPTSAAGRPAPAGSPPPAWRDRLIAWVARLLERAFFRSVETVGAPPRDGRVILAASHLNGFVDPVLLVAELGILPRFLAKATLWEVAPARPLLAFARIIPVRRRVDSGDATDNAATFAAAVDALRERHVLAVFPEGTTHDEASIRPLRTGVARIALDAAATGLDDVCIVPVGITYADKVAVRGRALIEFGEPLAVAAVPLADGEPDHGEVRRLTDRLSVAIRALTPDFESNEEALGVTRAAQISLQPAGSRIDDVPMSVVMDRARRLSVAPPAELDTLVDETGRYEMVRGALRLRDVDLVADRRLRTLTRRVAWPAALLVVLAPFALAGLFTNLVPALVVLAVGLVPEAPVSKGTIRLLVAVLVFPLTWLTIAVWDVGLPWYAHATREMTLPLEPVLQWVFGTRSGWGPSLLVFVSIPVLGALALLFVDRFRTLVADAVATRALIDRRGQLPAVLARRESVGSHVVEMLDAGTRAGAEAPA